MHLYNGEASLMGNSTDGTFPAGILRTTALPSESNRVSAGATVTSTPAAENTESVTRSDDWSSTFDSCGDATDPADVIDNPGDDNPPTDNADSDTAGDDSGDDNFGGDDLGGGDDLAD